MKIAPVLLLIWNRPDKTRAAIRSIKSAKPSRVYIACDGPIDGNCQSQALVKSCREIVDEEVDWDCILRKRYLPSNHGCKIGVESAISWFFDNEELGIIIEDDVVCDESFYAFASELLIRFKDKPNVGCITANYFGKPKVTKSSESYSATTFPHIWGWATWSRIWAQYDGDLEEFGLIHDFGRLYGLYGLRFALFWSRIFSLVKNGKIDTWDYQLLYMFLKRELICIQPNIELASNIGFDQDGTHTCNSDVEDVLMSKMGSMSFPLVHPSQPFLIDRKSDKEKFFRNYWPRKLKFLAF